MRIGPKTVSKMIGILIITCCAVFVCTLFLNFNLDISGIEDQIPAGPAMDLYEAQSATGKVISAVSGGCLLITSVVMLFFYIKQYIDTHHKELGILKALGYSDLKIAKGFWVFGISVFIGAAAGFCASYALMPTFYEVMNEEKILPVYSVHFHPVLFLFLVVLPFVSFSALSVIYARHKVKRPVIGLLRGTKETAKEKPRLKKPKQANRERTFVQELKRTTVKGHKALVFFICFAAFCYSAMMQMTFSMDQLASVLFSVIVGLIGIILACTTLFLAITTLVNANTKTIAMMRIMGYPLQECSNAVLGGYRPVAYIGFAIGTVYQYALLKIMVVLVFEDVAAMPEYRFDFPALLFSLVSFLAIYEIAMFCYSRRIRRISLKEIMLEDR